MPVILVLSATADRHHCCCCASAWAACLSTWVAPGDSEELQVCWEIQPALLLCVGLWRHKCRPDISQGNSGRWGSVRDSTGGGVGGELTSEQRFLRHHPCLCSMSVEPACTLFCYSHSTLFLAP